MRWRRRPEVIEAHQWTGSNWHEMLDFCGKGHVATDGRELFLREFVPEHGKEAPPQRVVPEGSWVVRRTDSAFDFMSDQVINQKYERIDD